MKQIRKPSVLMKAEPKCIQKKTENSGKKNLKILKRDNKNKNIESMFKT